MAIRLSKHVAAVADQGLYSVSNFALNILLARWLLEEQYGAFGTTYALFLMASLVHTALLTEPMLIFGSQHRRAHIFGYYRLLLRFHGMLSAVFILMALSAFFVLSGAGQTSLARGAAGIAISSWSILLLYLYRRICYVVHREGAAATAGGVYLVSLMVITLGLFRTSSLGVLEAYVAMGVSALVATVVLHALLMPARGTAADRPDPLAVVKEHYAYGRWAIGAGLLIWFPANVYYLVLPYAGGLEANGTFKALMNFAMPMIQTNLALANVLLPGLARIDDTTRFLRYRKLFVGTVGAGCVLYLALVGSLSEPLIRLLYGGRYVEHARLLWLIGLIPLVSWLALAERSAHKAINRPDVVFRASAVGSILAIGPGVFLTYRYGIIGAILSIIVAYAGMYLWLRRSRHLLHGGGPRR